MLFLWVAMLDPNVYTIIEIKIGSTFPNFFFWCAAMTIMPPNLGEMSPEGFQRSTDAFEVLRGDLERDQVAICRNEQSREHKYGK